MKNNNFDIGIFIASCDKYSDLWYPFFCFWNKYWPDCNLPIYLMSNKKRFDGVTQLFVSEKNWSDEMLSALDQFPHEYILYIQDDYFLNKKVNNERIKQILKLVEENQPAYFRLFPHCGPPKEELLGGYKDVQFISKGTSFITSLQAAIWHKESLKQILLSGENIWDFELNSPSRTKKVDRNFLSVVWQNHLPRKERDYPINYFCTAIRKGKWRKDAIAFCLEEGVHIDLSSRPIENCWDEFKKEYIYNNISPKYQPFVMKYIL